MTYIDLLPGSERVLSLATVTFPIFAFEAAAAHTVASGIAWLNSWQGFGWELTIPKTGHPKELRGTAITTGNSGDHPLLIFKLWDVVGLKVLSVAEDFWTTFSGSVQWQPAEGKSGRVAWLLLATWAMSSLTICQPCHQRISGPGEVKQWKRRLCKSALISERKDAVHYSIV